MSAHSIEGESRGTALQLVTHGGALFVFGLIAGLVFTFVVIGRVEVWPFLPALDITFPGSEAGWRRGTWG